MGDNDNEEAKSSTSDSDSGSSSDEEVEMDQEDESLRKKLETLNDQISDQPNSYDLLVEKIQLLQKMGELKELRKIRSTLSQLYPLTPALWLSWIHDEDNLVTDPEGKKEIMNLFEQAVKDYQSVQVWVEYIQLLREMGPDYIAEARVVSERALAAIGLHVLDGSLLWNAYRQLELELLSSNSTEEQKSRCTSLSFRQLGVPLIGMEETYDDVKTVFQIDETTEQGYKNGLASLKKLEVWERKLSESGNSSVAYKEYIEFEKSEKSNPARIVCLFERAICDNALDNSLWLDYINYTSKELQIGSVVHAIAERASRNCPWDVSIWSNWFQEVERFKGEEDVKDKVRGIFEQGLQYCSTPEEAGSLWLKYLQFIRRTINFQQPVDSDVQLFMKTLTTAEEHLSQLSPEPRDYIAEILFYGVRIQAHVCKSMSKSRKLFYAALHKGYGQQFKLWIQFFQLEQRYGDVSSTRKCLEKAMSVMSDGLEIVAELWLNFERDFGSLKFVQQAEVKIGEFLGKKFEADAVNTKRKGEQGRNDKKKFQKGRKGKRPMTRDDQDQYDGPPHPKKRTFSNPNPNHEEGQPSSAQPRQLKQKFEKITPRRPPKSFVPRSLQVQSNTPATLQPSADNTATSDTTNFKKPLTNADFRNLFKKPL